MSSSEISAARRMVRTLRAGVVDPDSARRTSVGTAAVQADFALALDCFISGRHPGPLVFEGAWGAGKTHLAMLLRGELDGRGIPWIQTAIDGKASSLSHLNRSVVGWLEGVRVGPVRGLRNAIERGLLSSKDTLEWSRTKSAMFPRGLWLALENGSITGWLMALGHLVAMPDYPYQHAKALELLLDAADYFKDVGRRGVLVLLLDELENVVREYDIRGRRRAYGALYRIANCGSLLPIFFVTSGFVNQCSQDHQRAVREGWEHWLPESRRFLDDMGALKRVHVPALEAKDTIELVGKLVDLHRLAYGRSPRSLEPDRILKNWNSTITRSTRLLVRSVIQYLDSEVD